MSAKHSKKKVSTSSTLKLIFFISIKTYTVLIDAVALPLLNLIDAFFAIDVFSLTVKSSFISARYYFLLTVDTFAALVSSKIL